MIIAVFSKMIEVTLTKIYFKKNVYIILFVIFFPVINVFHTDSWMTCKQTIVWRVNYFPSFLHQCLFPSYFSVILYSDSLIDISHMPWYNRKMKKKIFIELFWLQIIIEKNFKIQKIYQFYTKKEFWIILNH